MSKQKPVLWAIAAVLMAASPFVVRHEGMRTTVYDDPIWLAVGKGSLRTVCGGVVVNDPGKTRYTLDECIALTNSKLAETWSIVRQCATGPVTLNQAVAVLSLAYNAGPDRICRSTLVRRLNAGDPFCAEFDRWVFVGAVKVPGLVNRRRQERQLCEDGA